MLFRSACATDFDDVVRITGEARRYLADQGLDQWQGGNPSPARVLEDIERGYEQLAVDERTGEVLGCVAFCAVGEPDYSNVRAGGWLTESPNEDIPGVASYAVLHRLAVSDAARRRGVATFMIDHAVQMARDLGLLSVRVDTHEGNVPMQRAFEKCGFTRCCEIEITSPIEPTKKRIAYELVL